MERWRSFFGSSGEDLWTVIDRAVIIAAIDYPQELRVRRDGLAEKLFAPALYLSTSNAAEGPRLKGRVENLFDPNLCPLTSSMGERPALTRSEGGAGASPDSETADVLEGQHTNHQKNIPNSSDVETVKPLTEEAIIKESEESRQIREIRVIKEQIMNFDQGEEACFLQLCKLENMNICVPALKGTGIGKPVNALRKHASRRIRSVAKRLVSSWKDVVDEWVRNKGDDFANAFIDSGALGLNGCKNEIVLPCQDINGVPDDVAGSTKIMDTRDYKFSTESWQMGSSEHRPFASKTYDASLVHPEPDSQSRNLHRKFIDSKEHRGKWDHEYDLFDKVPDSRHRNSISSKEKFECVGEGSKSALECVRNSGNKLDTARQDHMAHHSPHPSEVIPGQNLSICKAVIELKPKCNGLNQLEAAKRRLQENYQQAEKVKKQRTLQVG